MSKRGKYKMKNKRRCIYLGLTLGTLAVCMIAVAVLYRFRGSVKVVASEDIPVSEAVFYQQTDDRWAEDFLGASTYTMESSGCLVTCIAAALQMSEAEVFGSEKERQSWQRDPGELNRYLSQKHVYDSQGNLQWGKLAELEHIQVDVGEYVSADIIQEYLRTGRYPIVRVRVKGYGSFHYVLVVASMDGVFYCMDPLNQNEELVPLSDYMNRVYAIRCVYPE